MFFANKKAVAQATKMATEWERTALAIDRVARQDAAMYQRTIVAQNEELETMESLLEEKEEMIENLCELAMTLLEDNALLENELDAADAEIDELEDELADVTDLADTLITLAGVPFVFILRDGTPAADELGIEEGMDMALDAIERRGGGAK